MIEIQNLNKRYKTAEKNALSDINVKIKPGEFVALLGPNGAGKTTLINTLIGNVQKTSGTVKIGKYDLDTEEIETKKILGVVPQEIAIDSFFTVEEVLKNYSGYFGIRNNEEYIDELLKELSLFEKKKEKARSLSGGMKRRLVIAKALLHKPNIFLLDEPTAGVDIELRQQLYGFLRKLHEKGMTIILTTHYLEEAEMLCDRVIVINHGKIIEDKPKKELLETLGGNVRLEFQFDEKITKNQIEFLKEFSPCTKENSVHVSSKKTKIGKVFELMNTFSPNYRSFRMDEEDLEDVFLKLVREKYT